MEILGIVGSPRREGNTAVLVRKVLEGAQTKKVKTRLIYLNDLKIAPCQSCYFCLEKGGRWCRQKDDMQIIYKALAKTKILVWGSPIYMNYVTAQAKLFIDRLFPYVHNEHLRPKGLKKGVLVFTWGWQKEDGYDKIISEVKDIITVLDLEVVKVIKATGLRYRKTEVLQRPDILSEAFQTGVGLARYLKRNQ